MDRQLIKTLIDALEASDLTELEYTSDGATLRLVKGSAPAKAPPIAIPPVEPTPKPDDDLIQAPLYGVVHLQRTPGAPPFVTTGQTVEPGQILCTIEAMKVFTDIQADRPGTITEILVTTAQEVEAGQPLLRLA